MRGDPPAPLAGTDRGLGHRLAGEVVGAVERRGPAREPGEQLVQLRPEPRVVADRVVRGLELLERADQRLGHVAPAEVALLAPAAEGVDLEQARMHGRRAEGDVGPMPAGVAGALDEEGDRERVLARPLARRCAGRSVPEATSTPVAGTARTASATFAGPRPPARVTGTSRATAAASAVSTRSPGAARVRAAGGVEEDPRGARVQERAGAGETTSSARSAAPTRSAFHTGRPDGRDGGRRLVPVELDRVGVDRRRSPGRGGPPAGPPSRARSPGASPTVQPTARAWRAPPLRRP